MARQPGTQEQRDRRNTLVMQFFFAGWSEREIARHHSVQLTPGHVHWVINKELKKLAGRHQLLSDKAMPMYIERLESLFKVAYSKALQGDLKAVEVARRIAEQQARLWNLEEDGRMQAPPPAVNDQELEEPENELAAFRAKRRSG